MANTHFTGSLVETDRATARGVSEFLFPKPTLSDGFAVSGTWTVTRGAAGNYFLRRTASAAAQVFEWRFTPKAMVISDTADTSRGEVARGARIESLDMVYAITVAAMDAVTVALDTTAFTNGGTIPTTVSRPVTGTAVLTAAATYKKTNFPVTTPFVVDNTMDCFITLTVDGDAGAAGLFDLYGFYINYDLLL